MSGYRMTIGKAGSQVQISAPSAWAVGTSYARGAFVSYSGNNYVAVRASVGQYPTAVIEPPNTPYWHMLDGLNMSIWHPYSAAELADVKYCQSSDVMWLSLS